MSDTTIREQIVQAGLALVQDAFDDDGRPLFETVVRGSVSSYKSTKLPACGIIEGDEEIEQNIHPFIDKILPVEIEFRFKANRDDDPWEVFNHILGKLQVLWFATTNLGGLTYDVQELGNSPDIDQANSVSHMGTLFLELKYRHRRIDPFTQV